MAITKEDIREQSEHCDKCDKSMEFCLFHKCPYHMVQHYTDEMREYAKKLGV